MKRLVKFLKWINLLLIFVTIISYLSPFIDPGIFWPPAVLGLIYPILLSGNLLFVLLWIFLKKPLFLYSVICILLGWNHLTGFVGLRLSPPKASEEGISIMSFNCHSWMDYEDKPIDQTNALSIIVEENPDILCLQEFPGRWERGQKYIREILENTSMKYHFRTSSGRLVILSRYPLEKKREKNFSSNNRTNGYQYLDVNLGEEKIRLFNLHLESNIISKIADKVASEGKLNEKKTWQDVKGIIGRYVHTTKKRAKQAEEVAEHIQRSPLPVILCGDLNDIAQSYVFRTLSSRLHDLFKAKGHGLGKSYSGSIPALRIDFILYSPELTPIEYHKTKTSFSDHYAVSGRIGVGG